MKESSNQKVPPAEFYENPYLPSPDEAGGYLTIPLLPVEAHYILVNNVGKVTSVVDRMTLQRISESDDSETALDYKVIRKLMAEELKVDNDWG